MKIIVGLGNIGDKYDKTRHNIGFEVVDKLASELGITDYKDKFQGKATEVRYKGEKVLLLKPSTFMNLSGNSLIEAVNFYKVDPENDVIVIYDDMDLPLGKLRIRKKGSAGGHNGIKSIISHIGDKFIRIRCGIGKPEEKTVTINYVLGKFAKSDMDNVEKMIKDAVSASLDIISQADDNIEKVIEKYN